MAKQKKYNINNSISHTIFDYGFFKELCHFISQSKKRQTISFSLCDHLFV